MASPSENGPQCIQCATFLYRQDDPVFAGTVLAVGGHDCTAAKKVVAQAATAAQFFASQTEFVHVRYISPIITPEAWIATLQEWTTTHNLAHRVLPLPDGSAFVVSSVAGIEIDMNDIMAKVAAQIAAVGRGPAPERLIGTWESGRLKLTMTHSGDRATP